MTRDGSGPALAALAAAAVLVGGCGGDDDEPGWAGPPRAAPDGALEVGAFNAHLDERDDDADASPLAAAAEFLQLGRQQATTTSIEVTSPPEGRTTATAVAVLDGILDDSVRGVRYTVELRRRGAGWRLASARREQRCHEGRGHREFSPELCV